MEKSFTHEFTRIITNNRKKFRVNSYNSWAIKYRRYKMKVSLKAKEIDIKSLIIGFLLAVVLFLTLGSSSGTQDVRIVGISTYDDLKVKIEDIKSSLEFPVEIKDVKYDLQFPVKIVEVKYSLEVPVKISSQPIEVKVK